MASFTLSEHLERVAAQPEDASVQLACARAHLDEELYRGAIKHADSAEAAGAPAADACEILAAAHIALGKRGKARAAVSRGLAAAPGGHPALERLRAEADALAKPAPKPAPAPARPLSLIHI